MILTDRDLEIIAASNLCARMFTLTQVAATWWSSSDTGRKNAAKRLSQLCKCGLMQRDTVLAQPMLSLSSPEYAWFPGERGPKFGELSWRLQSRWSGHPQHVVIYFATPRGLAVFGGSTPGKIKNLCQVTHDLHMAAVYLTYRQRWPHDVRWWVGEDFLAPFRRKQKLPDAMLVNAQAEPYRAVEFGGAYSARRLMDFHADNCQRGIPYEIW
jgi:hypothetical protein